jgi:hypothetical protein
MANHRKLEDTKKLMEALVRQPPKLHDEMKVGKGLRKPTKDSEDGAPKSPAKPNKEGR